MVAEPERLRRQHEVRDIAAAIDRAVDAERLVGMDDRDMRRAEEIEILQRLSGVGRLVAARDAERVVELKSALAPALQVDAAIFARERKIAGVRLAAGSGCRTIRSRNFSVAAPRRDHELPRLAVAP